jgi:hypothetical protein
MRRLIVLVFSAALAAFAQQPRIENGRLEVKAVAGTLESTMRALVASQSSPAWVGYAVPIVPGDRQVCGWDGGKQGGHHLSLEGPAALFVLYRVEQNAISKVLMATPDCDIDAGGLPVTWLTGVSGAESVRYLDKLAMPERLADSALSAIALHRDTEADRALDARLDADQPDKIREKAVMWLSVSRHRYERVVQVAHNDKSPRVRGQALFWLAQSAQKKLAADAIAGAIDNDPETEVKKKAVFALSQMADGEGVPKLIEIAKTNRNTAVRKQALFWLGQSKDPRALEFIEQVLTR